VNTVLVNHDAVEVEFDGKTYVQLELQPRSNDQG
jgi:hypothetical protein